MGSKDTLASSHGSFERLFLISLNFIFDAASTTGNAFPELTVGGVGRTTSQAQMERVSTTIENFRRKKAAGSLCCWSSSLINI